MPRALLAIIAAAELVLAACTSEPPPAPLRFPGLAQGIDLATDARDVLPDCLRAAGAIVDVVDAYGKGMPVAAPEMLRQALGQPIDAATFTSSSTATNLAEAAAKAGIAFPLPGVPAVSVGPITSQTLRELGWSPAAEADPHDIPGLIAAVAGVLTR